MYTFPAGDFQSPRALLGVLGSFWARTYGGADQVEVYCDGVARAAEQAHLDLLEAVAAVARVTVPIYHVENWTVLYVRESELTRPGLLAHGDGAIFDGTFAYGVPSTAAGVPAPDRLADVSLIFNRIADPSRTWTRGLDFTLAGSEIRFRTDPFADPLIPKRTIFAADGAATDREIALWLFRGKFDWKHAYDHFGYALGVAMASSETYRSLINAVFDAIVGGTAAAQVELALSAICGVPLVAEDGEIVVAHFRQGNELIVVTDLRVYRFAAAANLLVEVGDVLVAGAPLVDALRVETLNRGAVPAGLAALAMGRGFLAEGYYADLAFADRDEPLTVTEVDGAVRVSFPISGFPADVEAFWDEIHARGLASGTTLAQLLDTRGPAAATEPTAASLPATINPLKFLVENVLRSNCCLARVRAEALGAGSVGLEHAHLLRRIVPPHEALILFVEMPHSEDSITMDLAPEDLESFTAAEPLEDTIDAATLVAEGPLDGRVIGGRCL